MATSKETPPDTACVYFISAAEAKPPFKIGSTIDLKQRIPALQTGNSEKLNVVGAIYTKSYKKVEKDLHTFFEKEMVRAGTNKEWFNIPVETVNIVIDTYYNMMDVDSESEDSKCDRFIEMLRYNLDHKP